MITISIIIPVYNAERYLSECIESLLLQTLSSCEFIFVNDGSKDNSQNIIQSFQEKDNRIQIINQKNQGVSVARNNGIDAAKGNYIGFLDADDYVTPIFFESLYNQAQQSNCDVVVSRYTKEIKGNFFKSPTSFNEGIKYDAVFLNEKILPYMIQKDNLNSCWNKIFKADLLKSNAIYFPKNVALGEDGLFNFKAFHFAKSIIFINESGYFYREVEGSASRNNIEKDYFSRALEVYHFDYEKYLNANLKIVEIQKLKGIRLVEKVLSYVSIYLNGNGTFFSRYNYVKKMISNKIVQENIHLFWDHVIINKSKFDKFVLFCIKNNIMVLLVLATKYSSFRNKK